MKVMKEQKAALTLADETGKLTNIRQQINDMTGISYQQQVISHITVVWVLTLVRNESKHF